MSPHQYLYASLRLLLQSRDAIVAAARAVTDDDARLAILPEPAGGAYTVRTLHRGERPRKTAVVIPVGVAATDAALGDALVAWAASRLATLPAARQPEAHGGAASGALLDALVAWSGAHLAPERTDATGSVPPTPLRRRQRRKRGGRRHRRRVLDVEGARTLLLKRYGFVEERPGHYRRPLAGSCGH